MPWKQMQECEECGSTDIRLIPDDDPSVGYYANVWRCHRGHNCEYWEPDGDTPESIGLIGD